MGPVQRITESIVHDALPLPKVGAVIGGKKVTSVKVSSTDRDYYTTGITLERGAKRKDIQAGLSELLNCHILNSQVGDLAVRVTHFEMIPTKKGPTIYVVMRIVPMVYNNPGKTELTAKEDFEKHYGPEFTAKNPKKWFREFAVKNPHGPAHRDKLWKFVGWVGESYGYCDKDTMYHRRASTIMPKIKITKAIDGANTFYHTHPSKDEPSLTSPDDYMLYFDLSQEPRNIRHFYTIMKDRIDYFKITPRKENRDAYVRIDQDKFLDEVDAKIDELMDKHSDDFPDDKQGGLNFCEKVTKQTVKWLNKKYGKYVKITYSCFYRVRKNPEETDFTNLHLGDSFIARAIADIRSGEYSWPSTDVNQMPQEKYAYWFGQYYFMDDDPEKQVGLLASQQEFESVGRVRDRTRKIGFLPGRLKGINHYLDLKIHEGYSNYDMMNLMNLHIDIMRLDSDVTDGGGVKTRLEELAKQLDLPDEIRDNLIMIEEARILGAHTEEAKTLSGDFYMVLLLVDLCQRAVEVMDEVRAGTKTLEYAKYEIYAKLKEQAIRLLDVEISAYMNAFNQGKKSMRLNPPPRFKKGEFEAFIPPEYLQATGIVTEALEQYAPYQEGKPFLTGRNKVNMRVPSNGTVSTVMIGSLNTGNLQIIVPAKGHPMPDDASAAALEAYQAVVNRLNEYGLNIPTEEQEVGSLTVSNPRKNNQLIIVAGPSGAGKSTTLRNLDKMLPNSKLIRSYVTRPKRKSDRSGEKNFVTEKQFKEMVAGGEFLEHAKQKSGDYYGKRLEDFKADADYLITEASLSGVNRLKKAFPGAYTVYLEPSESAEMIRKRLLRRGDMSPQMARGRSSKIPSHIKSSKMMPFDKRIITRQGKFDSIALEIMDSIPRSNPASPFRVPKGVVMENPNLYYEAHLHTSRSTNNFFPGDVPVAPPDLLRGNPPIGKDAEGNEVMLPSEEAVDMATIVEAQAKAEKVSQSIQGDDNTQIASETGKRGVSQSIRGDRNVQISSGGKTTISRNPSSKPVSIRIEESPNKAKKMVAYFYDKEGKKVKTTHFGARGMSDYTQHKDPKRKDNYLSRHGGMGEDWKDPTTAGALSRWILWGKPSLRESFNDYKKKFKIEGVMAVTNTRMNPKAPGYNSYAWTTQDWRSIKVNNKGEVDYSKKCGAEDTQVADGTPRLCLPAEVVRTLIKSKNGKEILLTQARKKARAAKGQRVPWHPRIKEIWKRVEDKTVKDRPNPPNANLAPGNRVFNEPLLEALEVAKGYMGSMGKTYKTTVPIKRINEPLMRRMAKAYDETPNGYDDSKTIKSYEAFIKETNAQFLAIKAAGYVVEIDDDDPYRSSQDMIDDLRNNKRLKIFSAEAGFGSKPITDEQRKKNVLLRRTKHKDINGKTLLVEEMFRFTHDFFGHALKGNGFGPIGEENAWSSHSMMYSPLARPAMTTETRAQFAWTFYSGANRQTEKTRRLANILRREGKMEEAERIRKEIQGNFLYPDQKMILLPNEFTENKYPLDNPGEWRHGKMMDDDKDPFASMFN